MSDGLSRPQVVLAEKKDEVKGHVDIIAVGDVDLESDAELWRRRIRHDIRHELATIVMLASAVAVSDDIGAVSRSRVEALIGETRWLGHLLHRLDEDDAESLGTIPERIDVSALVSEVVAAERLATRCTITFKGEPASARIDPLALWRAVRNVLDNACRNAAGRVDVLVGCGEAGWTVIQIDDDGPGFGAGAPGTSSLGLGIVHDLIDGYGGALEFRECEMGGARVRVQLPAAAT